MWYVTTLNHHVNDNDDEGNSNAENDSDIDNNCITVHKSDKKDIIILTPPYLPRSQHPSNLKGTVGWRYSSSSCSTPVSVPVPPLTGLTTVQPGAPGWEQRVWQWRWAGDTGVNCVYVERRHPTSTAARGGM